ncbi:MAG TPA: GNAT family N-acetyltransferase [Rhodocyclaceae bacterium]|nr:GNAT family N-acetyltransferase [Rhodocyclaceae bacterium]
MPAIEIVPLAPPDVAAVIALARRIWNAHYPGIISQQQIDYMLAQRYTMARLQQELTTPEIRWELARQAGQILGFAATIHLPEARELKLDKLYVAPEAQGRGVGRALVASALARAQALACGALILAVNKNNAAAIAAYRRFGFVVRAEAKVEIGAGFVMDDFIMARSL